MSTISATTGGRPGTVRVVLDSHVHLHPIHDEARVLDAAIANARSSLPDAALVWLLLTEMAGVDAFTRLARQPPAGFDGGLDADGLTLELRRGDGARVRLTAGRQVQTREGLELLALGTRAAIPDGIALCEAIRRAHGAGALAVIPWGVGKWLGRRGHLVADLQAGPDGEEVYLGDNMNRPTVWPTPTQFATAVSAGRRVLPGTDPLPLPRHVDRVAAFGLGLEIEPTAVGGFPALRALIADPRVAMQPCGRRSGIPAFLFDQAALRLNKAGPPRARDERR